MGSDALFDKVVSVDDDPQESQYDEKNHRHYVIQWGAGPPARSQPPGWLCA
jgi:hypothetical protein